jgi:purine-binding chemotaxis protein CheW
MVDEKPVSAQLLAHEEALHSLLDSLLAEVGDEAAETQSGPRRDDLPCATKSMLNSQVSAPLTDQGADTAATASDDGGCREPPAWAGQRFRALAFRIGEQRFAMPLVLMARVALMPDRLNRMPAQPDWHLGVARLNGVPVVVAELGRLFDAEFRCANPRYLLMVGDGRTAVICDLIEDPLTVESDQVRWRAPKGHREWMAGVLIQELCMLLDPVAIDSAIRHG